MEKICNCCKQNKSICDFRKNRISKQGKQYYQSKCKVCERNTDKNVKNKGQHEKYKKLKEQGLKFCPDCKNVKDLSNFKADICTFCSTIRIKNWRNTEKGKEKSQINDLKYKLGFINEEIIEIYKLKRQIRNLFSINFENKQFKTKEEFGRYLFNKYNIPVRRTTSRMLKSNAAVDECLLSNKDFRILKNNTRQCFKCTDEKGNVLIFYSKMEMMKTLKIGPNIINKCIMENIKTWNYKNSYKNRPIYKIEQL